MKKLVSIICVMSMLLTAVSGISVFADAAAAETYAWYTSGTAVAPIQAARYFIPDTANLYSTVQSNSSLVTAVEGGWETALLNDGSYGTDKDIIMKSRSATGSSMTFDPELDNIIIEFDKSYVLSKLMVGASSATSNGYQWNNSLRNMQISYYDDAAGEWVFGETFSAGRIANDDTANVAYKFYRTITFSKSYTTTKLRFEFVEAAQSNRDFTGITELIPYGFDADCLKETYAWNTSTTTASAPISGTYSIGSAVTAKDGTELNPEWLYDGDYATVQKVNFTKNTEDNTVVEDHYYEVAFDKAYLIDTVNIGFKSGEAQTTIPARSMLEYRDADTGEWVRVSTVYDTYWPTDKSAEILYKKIKNLAIGPVRATGVRYYPARLTTDQTGGYHLSELVVCGKLTYEYVTESYDWLTPGSEATAPINGTYAIGSAVTPTDASKVTKEDPSFLNDGDYSNYMEAQLSVTTGISKIEDHFYEVTFDNAYDISEVIVGFPETGVTVPARAQLQYKDPVTEEWVDIDYYEPANSEHAYAPYWPSDGTAAIKNKWTKALPVDNIIAKGIRFYPARLTISGSKGYYRLSEFIVRGKNVSDIIKGNMSFTVGGEESQDFAAEATAVTQNISIINPTADMYDNAKVITAFYNNDTLIDVNMADAVNDNEAAYSSPMIINVAGLDIPDGATKVKMYFWNLDAGLKPILDALEKTKIAYAADNENIKYAGRWTTDESGSKTSYYGGAYAEANFTGDNAVVVLGDVSQGVHIIVDGTEDYRPEAYGDIDVSSLLDSSKTVHTIRVVSRFYNDNVVLKGFMFDDIAAKTADKPIIEFIGDSITAGHQGTPATYTANKAMIAYPYLVGEALGCDHTQIAVSGKP
ncbi:MAG: hypothetical protein ACI4DY_11605, partial [Monoglobaceae bacterium]